VLRCALRKEGIVGKYTIRMVDEGGSENVLRIEAPNVAEAAKQAEKMAEDWVSPGDWGAGSVTVRVYSRIYNDNGENVWQDTIDIRLVD